MIGTETSVDRISILAGLFRDQLGLPDTPPRVFIYNQAWKIPDDEDLFVEVALLNEHRYAASLGYIGTPDVVEGDKIVTGNLTEERTQNVREVYTVDLFSVNQQARQNRFRCISALYSTQAQQLCEKYSMKLATLPTAMVDLSATEASRRLNRFQATFSVLGADALTMPVDFYNKFASYPGPSLIIQP